MNYKKIKSIILLSIIFCHFIGGGRWHDTFPVVFKDREEQSPEKKQDLMQRFASGQVITLVGSEAKGAYLNPDVGNSEESVDSEPSEEKEVVKKREEGNQLLNNVDLKNLGNLDSKITEIESEISKKNL